MDELGYNTPKQYRMVGELVMLHFHRLLLVQATAQAAASQAAASLCGVARVCRSARD